MTIETLPAAPQSRPPAIWRWHVFGKDSAGNSPITVESHINWSWWFRARTIVFLGSKWERLNKQEAV